MIYAKKIQEIIEKKNIYDIITIDNYVKKIPKEKWGNYEQGIWYRKI